MNEKETKDTNNESPIEQIFYRLSATILLAIHNDPILIAMIESFCKEKGEKEHD